MNPLNLFRIGNDFKQQLEDFRPRLYQIAYAWSHDTALADDLVQETMLKALKSSQQVKNTEAIDGWLFGILTNCWRDHFRRHKECENIDDIVLVDEITPVQLAESQNIVDKVRAAVAKLPAGQCQVMTLIDLEGMSYTDVADVLEIPVGTVMSRLCRARNTLSQRLLELRPDNTSEVPYLRRVQ